MIKFFKDLFNPHAARWAKSHDPGEVTIMRDTITYSVNGGVLQLLAFELLDEVAIETDDSGPLRDDVFWRLKGRGGELLIPSTAKGADTLLERLQQLPDFDNEAVAAAAASATHAVFPAWKSARARGEAA